jgi:hypothetical protein
MGGETIKGNLFFELFHQSAESDLYVSLQAVYNQPIKAIERKSINLS